MAVMGFTYDPGPLPFTTIRDAKWANRLEGVPPYVEIVGEHGCAMPRQVAKVLGVTAFDLKPPPRLVGIYQGHKLVAIELDVATSEELAAAGIPRPA